MSGTWSRKRRNANTGSVSAREKAAGNTATAQKNAQQSNSWDGGREHFALPPALLLQQQLLSRSTDRMFEEAEATGVLNLVGRKLKEFPQALANKFDISDLVSADLSSNRLHELPPGICELKCLESLRMRANVIKRIPSDVSLLDRLTFVDFSNNHLTAVPLSLFELPIEILLLSGNRLDTLPREIGQLSATLTELDLSCNHLQSIPSDMAVLKMLRVLNLRKNELDQFPSELCRLTLHTLDLSCNNFAQIPLHIRKMKSLVIFRIEENPLQTPPARILAKGREHIFKWMDLESGGGIGMRSGYSTLRARNVARNPVLVQEDNNATQRKLSAGPVPVVERRGRNARFATLASIGQGSDSGYASTADEHRLSHELPITGLDDITEVSILSPSPDEGLGEIEITIKNKTNGSPMDTISSSSQDSSPPVTQTSSTSVNAHIVQKKATHEQNQMSRKSTVSLVAKIESTTIKAVSSTQPSDVKNNNTSVTETSERKFSNGNNITRRSVPTAAKPISKVAPLVQNSSNIESKPGGKPASKIATRPVTVPPSNMASKTASARPVAPPPSRPVFNRASASLTQKKPMSSRLASSSSSSVSSSSQRPSTAVPPPPEARKLSSKSSSLDSTQAVEQLRKAFKERIGVSLEEEREKLALQLSDGVFLCNFVNALKMRTVSTVLTPTDNTPLSPLKAKRNIENFVNACRRLGVPEMSLCNVSDVIAKRNVLQTARTIIALQRNFSHKAPKS